MILQSMANTPDQGYESIGEDATPQNIENKEDEHDNGDIAVEIALNSYVKPLQEAAQIPKQEREKPTERIISEAESMIGYCFIFHGDSLSNWVGNVKIINQE